MAQHVVFRPNAEQRAQLREPPLPYVVQVVPWRQPADSVREVSPWTGEVARQLRLTGAFQTLLYLPGSRTPAPGVQLIAEATLEQCAISLVPFFTVLTLGLVPTVFTDRECSGAVFRRADGTRPQDSVVVRIRHQGKAVMGWAAAPLGLLPAFSYRSARGQKGYHQAFRLAIIAKREELAALAAAK